MSNPRPTEEPSVADLVDRLSEQTARLVRDELKLARAEYTQKAKQGGTAVGLSGVASGAVAGILFKQIWKRAASEHTDDTPKALESEFPLRQIVLAAAIQGALYATVKALVDRGGARAFEKVFGEWPGD